MNELFTMEEYKVIFKAFLKFVCLAILINITFVVLMIGAAFQHSNQVIHEQQHTEQVVQRLANKH